MLWNKERAQHFQHLNYFTWWKSLLWLRLTMPNQGDAHLKKDSTQMSLYMLAYTSPITIFWNMYWNIIKIPCTSFWALVATIKMLASSGNYFNAVRIWLVEDSLVCCALLFDSMAIVLEIYLSFPHSGGLKAIPMPKIIKRCSQGYFLYMSNMLLHRQAF